MRGRRVCAREFAADCVGQSPTSCRREGQNWRTSTSPELGAVASDLAVSKLVLGFGSLVEEVQLTAAAQPGPLLSRRGHNSPQAGLDLTLAALDLDGGITHPANPIRPDSLCDRTSALAYSYEHNRSDATTASAAAT